MIFMDCILAPKALIPETSRLKDQNYYLPFIKHLNSHLIIIEKFRLHEYLENKGWELVNDKWFFPFHQTKLI